MMSDKNILGRCRITPASDFARGVVTIPPCPSPPLLAGALHHFGVSNIQLIFALSLRNSRDATKLTLVFAFGSVGAVLGTTEHGSPVLIFDELEHKPFTENHRWPSGKVKIARCGTPAMLRNHDDE